MILVLKAGAMPLQDTSVTVTLKVTNTPLEKIFLRIENQTGLSFVYSTQLINGDEKISVTFYRERLSHVLHALLTPRKIRWLIRDNGIVLLSSDRPDPPPPAPRAIPVVHGRVMDRTHTAIPGVTIRIKNTTAGAISDATGRFTVPAREGSVLEFSMVGYQPTSIVLGNELKVNVTMAEDVAKLGEVVVKGYYTTTKAFNTGSVSSVAGRDMMSQSVGDPVAALAGRVPGLFVVQDRGIPGRGVRVQLRGTNSISNRNDPLYIVDGVPYPAQTLSAGQFGGGTGYQSPLNSLNMSDIESITVLKDADATAIYGSQGANGVILITTKKGNGGKTSVDANYFTGWAGVTRRIDLLNTPEYLAVRREALRNDQVAVSPMDYDINGAWDTTRYTDWQDVLIGGTARINDAQVRITGGTGNTRFNLGSGYRKETSVFPGSFFDKKLSLNAGADHTSPDGRLKAGFSLVYVSNENEMPEADLTSLIHLPPNAPALYDSLGRLNWEKNSWTNPFSQLYRNNKTNTNNYLGNVALGYEILPGLTLKASVGINQMLHRQRLIQPSAAQPPARQQLPEMRVHMFSRNRLATWVAEPQLTYETRLFDGRLEMLAGATFRESTQEVLTQRASNFADDGLIENLQAAGTVSTLYSGATVYRYNAAYGRLGYTLKERYVVNFTARRDGSSRFGPGRQFGNFGAAGAAWIFSREPFMRPLAPGLSFGKIRASIGVTGNDQLPDYQYLSTYENLRPGYVYLNNVTLAPTRLHNPDFGWEEVTKLEAAIDLGFFAGRLEVSGSWYRNRTNNQLVGYALPQMTGFTTIQANLPAVVQNTGVELDVSGTLAARNAFHWEASANISFPRNKLVAYPGFENSAYRQTYQVGKSMLGSYRFHYTGVDPNTGLFSFEDLDGDGVITYTGDRSFVVTEPRFHGGLSNRLRWKNAELSFLWQFVQKKSNMPRFFGGPGNYSINQPVAVLDRWQEKGDEGRQVQRYSSLYNQFTEFFETSDGVITDASFLRLKSLYIAYTLPEKIMKRFKRNDLRIYLQGRNLVTFTKFKGLDPEPSSGALALPPVRVLAAGLQLVL